MTLKEQLLKRLPKKYHDRVKSIEVESDLIDGCKYIVYHSDNYTDGECVGGSYPVRSLAEAVRFIKDSLISVEKKER